MYTPPVLKLLICGLLERALLEERAPDRLGAARLTGCAVLAHPEALTASDRSPVWAQFEV